MSQSLYQPQFWTDRVWAELHRLAQADDTWRKAAHSPQLYGLTSQGVAMAGYLLDRGCLPSATLPEDGVMTAAVPLADRVVEALFDDRPEVREEVGRYPAVPSAWHALALLEVAGHRRSVTVRGGSLTVTVGLPFRRSKRSDVLDDLELLVAEYRQVLDAGIDRPGAGYADLVSSFIDARLAVPHLPSRLRDALVRTEEWCWSTRADDAELRSSDYMMASASVLDGAVADHATVSHGGHGIGSYALTWRMASGPLAFIVQEGWGGCYGGPADHGRLAETFARVAVLVDHAEKRVSSQMPTGEWVRPVLVEFSGLRGIFRCTVWDPVRGERVELEIDEQHPWVEIAKWIDVCGIPAPTAGERVRWRNLLARRSR